MARPTGSHSRTAEQSSTATAPPPATPPRRPTRSADPRGLRADRRRPKPTTGGHAQADGQGVQRGQPHRLGGRAHLLRRPGAVPGPDRAAVDHRPADRPQDAHRRAHRRRPGERRRHAEPGHRGPGRQQRPGRLGLVLGLALPSGRRRATSAPSPRRQRRLRDARGAQDLEAQAAAAAGHPDRHPVRRRDPRDAGAQRTGRRRHRPGHRGRRDRPDGLERRQVAGRPRRPGADDRRPLLLDAERAAARLQVGQPRCRRCDPRRDRGVGARSPSTSPTSAATTRPTARSPAS